MSHKTAKRERQAQKREMLVFVGRLIANFRKALGPTWNDERTRFPDQKPPCETCAFRVFTDAWKGYEKTVFSLAGCLVTGRPFYCHVNPTTGQPFPRDAAGEYRVQEAVDASKDVSLCAGWATLQTLPEDTRIRMVAEAVTGEQLQGEVTEEFRRHLRKLPEVFGA